MSICGTRNVAGANVSTSGLVFFGSLTSFLFGMLVPATFPVPPLLITSKQNMAHMKAAISLECRKTFYHTQKNKNISQLFKHRKEHLSITEITLFFTLIFHTVIACTIFAAINSGATVLFHSKRSDEVKDLVTFVRIRRLKGGRLLEPNYKGAW